MNKEEIIEKFANVGCWIGDSIGKQEMGDAVIKVVGAEGFNYESSDKPKELKLGFRFYKEKNTASDMTFFFPIIAVKKMPGEKSIFEEVCDKLEEHYKNYEAEKCSG